MKISNKKHGQVSLDGKEQGMYRKVKEGPVWLAVKTEEENETRELGRGY